jgi:hypothetical protein
VVKPGTFKGEEFALSDWQPSRSKADGPRALAVADERPDEWLQELNSSLPTPTEESASEEDKGGREEKESLETPPTSKFPERVKDVPVRTTAGGHLEAYRTAQN